MRILLQEVALGCSCRRQAQEGEARRLHVSASCLCERNNKAGARSREPEASHAAARNAVKKARITAKGEGDDDDRTELTLVSPLAT